MVQAAIFECLFNFRDLVLAHRLELLEDWLNVIALPFQKCLKKVPLGGLETVAANGSRLADLSQHFRNV